MRASLVVVALFLAAFFIVPARAQTSLYGGVSVASYCNGGNNNGCKDDTVGFTGGATYLFPSSSRLKAGLDGRFDASPGNKGGEAALFALRIAFVPHQKRVSPYFQIGGGYIHTTYPLTYCTASGPLGTISYCGTSYQSLNGGALELAAGFNVRLTQHTFIRPLELMGSAGSNVGHASIGTAFGYQF